MFNFQYVRKIYIFFIITSNKLDDKTKILFLHVNIYVILFYPLILQIKILKTYHNEYHSILII